MYTNTPELIIDAILKTKFINRIFLVLFLTSFSALLHAQPNNNCSGATALTVGAACTNGTNVGATLEAGETTGATGTGCWASAPSNTVWYTFTTGLAGNYTVSTDNGGSADTEIKILSGTCGAFTLAACNEDGGTVNAFAAVATASLAASTTYYVQVDVFGGTTTTFCINVSYSPPIANDCIFSAIDISAQINGINPTSNPFDCAAYTYAGGGSSPTNDNVNGNSTACDPGPDYRDIWFMFTVTASTPDVWIDVYQSTGTTPDYVAALYSGTPSGTCGSGSITGLTTIDCSDGASAGGSLDVGVCTTPIHPRLNASTLAPGTYYYRVWEWGGGTPSNGIINLCVETSSPVGITSDACPTAPNMGFGCGTAANVNINETYTNLSNAGCLGNACNTALNEPQLAVGGAGQIHNNCSGPWLTSVGYANNVMNNSAIYSFNVNGSGTCQATVTIKFSNITYAGTNGNVMQVQVMNAPCSGGASAVMAGTSSDPCFEMRSASGTLPNGTYYIVVDGQDGQLMQYDLNLLINYSGVGCTPTTPPPAPTAVNGSRCGTGTVNLSVTGCSGTATWYAAPTGGTALATGSSFTTPSISTTTTYYASCTVAGCEGARSPVTATVTSPQVATFSYTGSPYCSNAANPSPTFSGGGVAGTFSSSAGLSINSATGVVNLAASTPGTYTVTNTIAATGGCPVVTASTSITITPLPVASFSYTASPYCQNASNPSPTFSGGGVAGTFTSSAGLSINASTGVVNLAASTPGTYTVTNTVAAASGCPAVTATASITITPLPVASFSYTGSPYCQSASNPSPTFSGGGAAGTFTSSAGLSINASSGVVNLAASTPGTYTVTNTIAAASGCPAVTATASIIITPVPVATFSYTAAPYCQNASNPSPTFSGGGVAGTFSSTAGLIFVSTATGQINLSASTPGTYTVTNTIAASGGCSAATATANITITPVPVATFSYTASPYCQNASNPSPVFSGGGVAGTFTSTAGLVFISSATGQVNLSASTPGTYTVTNTIAASGGCPSASATASITITPAPSAIFSYTGSPYCQSAANPSPTFSGGGTAGTFSSTAGLVFVSSSTGQVNLSASTPGTYTITNTIAASGGCPAVSATATITITPVPVATFSYTASPYCQSASNPSPVFSGGGTAGTFTSAAGLVFVSASTGQVNLSASSPGTYTVTNTIAASGGCAAVTATASITITAPQSASFSYAASPYCQNASNPSPTLAVGATAGTFSSSAGLNITGSNGLIDLAASTAGTYTVTNTIAASGGCPVVSATASVSITPVQSAAFNYSSSTFCSTGTNPLPTISGTAGGTFSSSPAGLSINASTGLITLSTSSLNTYSVTYTTPGPCASSSSINVTITNAPAATFSYTASPYCQGSANPSPSFSGGGTAGTFTASPAGLVFVSSSTGQIDLSASTPGTYTVTNTIPASGGCAAASATANVTINAGSVASFSYTASPYCQTASNPSPTFSGGGTAGTFSAAAGLSINSSTGVVNLAASTAGTYTVTNTIPAASGCPAISATASITITAPQSASFSYTASPYCQNASNPSPTFSGGGVAGTFTSGTGLIINAGTGEVNLAASTSGTYTVTNTIAATGGCAAVTATASITITPAPAATFSYTASPYCQNSANPSPVFSGGGTAGTFTSAPGLSINSSTGAVNLMASTPGTYTVTNTIAASGGCPAVSATAGITITPLPAAGFSYTATPYCQNAGNPSPVFSGGGTAGTFSSTAGLVFISSGTGEVNLAASTAGTYTVTNTIPAASGCPAVTATASITINPVQNAAFAYSTGTFCQTGSNPTPTITGTPGGTFSATPAGLILTSSSTGEINLSASSLNTYTVTYTTSGPCAASSSTTITITNAPAATFSYTASPYCQGGSNPSPAFSAGATAGTFTASPSGLVFVSSGTGEIDLAASTPGTYTVTNTIAASGGCAATSATFNVTINASPVASFSYSGSPYCQSGTDPSPIFTGGGSAGTFSATAGLSINSSTGTVNLAASTAGTYTVTNTLAASGGCPAASANSSITITAPQTAAFSYSGPYCQNTSNPVAVVAGGSVAGTFTSSAGLVFANTSTGEINLASSSAGTYTITNTLAASGGCASVTANASVVINPVQNAAFNYSGSTFCQTGSNPVPTITGTTGGTFSSSPAGLSFVSTSTGEIDLSSTSLNTYSITYTTSGPCPDTNTVSVTITNAPDASFSYTASPYCQSGVDPSPVFPSGASGGAFSAGTGLTISTSGTVDLSASTPGTYTVTNTIAASGGCAAASSTASIIISPSQNAGFSYASSSFCQTGTNPTPTITGVSGGTFSASPAGLSFVSPATGEIDLASSPVNTYTITYTTPGPCADSSTFSISITNPPTAAFSYTGSPYCTGASNPNPTFSGSSIAGTFSSSPAGLLFISTATGEIDLANSSAGTYTITNTIAASGGCAAVTSTSSVTINPLQDAAFSYSGSTFCQTGTNPTPTITGVSGGTFSATPAGLVFASTSTGEINLSSSALNTYTITYTTAGPCAGSSTATVTISTSPAATFSYASSSYCQSGTNPSPLYSGGGSAGTFSSSPAGLTINSSNGVITLSSSSPGTYTVTNTIAASGGCPASAASATVTITAPQVATFSYTGSPYCQTGTNPSPTYSGGGVAGTFSVSPSGLSINPGTGLVDLASSTAGTFTVTNTIAASGGCAAVTATSTITINPLQNAGFAYPSALFCQSSANPTPVITGTSGGTFSSSPGGLSLNSSTGTIALSSSAVNTYTVTYTTPGPCANSSTVNITISTNPTATATCNSSVCSGQSITFNSTGGGSYTWDGPGAYSSTLQNPVITPAGVANSGTYTVTVNNGGCSDTAQVNVVVTAAPSADAGTDITIQQGSMTTLNAAGGSSYSWTPATGLSCTNCPYPVAAPTITTTYCVSASNGTCSDSDCVTITVEEPCVTSKDLGVPNAFSPNNDGINDQFCLQGWSACMDQFSILIYDRWGEKVFESNEADFCWNGIYKGKTLDPAVFVYFINASFSTGDNVVKKGNISIIR
jgi:gliding motility-associated-like protein